MASQNQKLYSALFIVAAISLLLVTVAFIRGTLGESMAEVGVDFPADMSVAGLSNGAKVTFNGVPIGTVLDVKLVADEDSMAAGSAGEEDVDAPTDWEDSNKTPRAQATLKVFQSYEKLLMRPGVRAELVFQGLTGSFSIDLTIKKDLIEADERRLAAAPEGEIRSIPAESSDLGEIMRRAPEVVDQVQVFVSRLNGVIDQNEDSFGNMLAAVDLLATEAAPRLVAALDEVDRMMRYAQARVLAPNGTLDKMEGSLETNLDRLTREMTASADQVAGDLSRTLEATQVPMLRTFDDLQVALADMRMLIGEMHGLLAGNREAVKEMLAEVRDAAESVESTMVELQAHPAGLLRGKPKKDGSEP